MEPPEGDGGGPAARGYRWPAEWEPHAGTWISWPHNSDTWPGRLAAAAREFVGIARELVGREAVHLLVADDAMEEQARVGLADGGVDPDRVSFERIATDDAWARDYGPVFLVRDDPHGGSRCIVDFGFDSWGRKYGPWDRDDAVPAAVAERLGLERFDAELVLEGGSIDGDGRGSVLTTESCLLHPNRGPGRTREGMEEALATWLGARRVLWLAGGIEGDDTDGHVDDVARFVAPSTVVAAVCEDAADANRVPLEENLRRLRGLRDADGKPLDVVELPMPRARRPGGSRVPASYANFYLANGVALVPIFGDPSDERALAILRELLLGREVIGVPCSALVVGLGAIHCLTQQEPAASSAPER